jgi:hypothetical protein
VIAKSIDRDATHFGIFSCYVVFANECLDLIAHCLIQCALARNRGKPSGFRPTTRFFNGATMTQLNSSQLSGALTFGKRPM